MKLVCTICQCNLKDFSLARLCGVVPVGKTMEEKKRKFQVYITGRLFNV